MRSFKMDFEATVVAPSEDSSVHRSQVLVAGLLLSLPALLWLMLWLGINTGPWVLKRTPATLLGWLHYLRTVFPFIVLFISWMQILSRPDADTKILSGPMKLWLVYGLICLGAGMVSSPKPFSATYWALCYLSVFAAINLFIQGPDPLEKAVSLNYLSWIVTTLFLAILIFTARDVLFVDSRSGMTGYGIIHRIGSVADIAMSRSSGMARFAAVPGIVSFMFIWRSRGLFLVFWATIFVLSGAMIYLMQSRGAIFGFAFAIFFIMLFLGSKTRRLGALFLILLGLVLYTGIIPEQKVEQVSEHVFRGQSFDEMQTMTGRTRAWKKGLRQVRKSPVWGWGPQADRYLIKEHVHNTYIYALMSSGFAGGAAFVGGLLWAWLLFLRILRNGTSDKLGHKVPFVQIGGILAFFTVRSIPEVTGAMFGVDLMVMLPAIAYLTVLDREGRRLETEKNEVNRKEDGRRMTEDGKQERETGK